jgi:hypothetical protein
VRNTASCYAQPKILSSTGDTAWRPGIPKIATECPICGIEDLEILNLSSASPIRKEANMQTPMFFKSRSFFNAYPVGEMVRGLFLSSILWIFLALAVYTVYSMVLGAK